MDMVVARLDPHQVSEHALASLGLTDVAVELTSSEALAASLRRAASFLCPATRGHIVRSVVEVLEGLPEYKESTKEDLEEVLGALIGYGDLLELPLDNIESSVQRIFLGPPTFVRRKSGSCLLIGVRPEGAQLIGDELSAFIEYDGHARMLRFSEFLPESLVASGLKELAAGQWLGTPRPTSAEELVADFANRLMVAGPSGDIENPTILDPTTRVNFYRGRWRPPRPADNGQFVSRRPQAYGADLWCYAHVHEGRVNRLIDLPVLESLIPACDEAWRLQAAIDEVAGHPQEVRIRDGSDVGVAVLDLFSPVPSWAQRRLDIVGTPLLRGRGALFSYAIARREIEEELQFLADMLWVSRSGD
jgi:hypothetical protein